MDERESRVGSITVQIQKGRGCPDVVIRLWGGFPHRLTMDEAAAAFEEEASRVHGALLQGLPQGTYDRLAAKMLQQVASRLLLPHQPRGGG